MESRLKKSLVKFTKESAGLYSNKIHSQTQCGVHMHIHMYLYQSVLPIPTLVKF